MFRVVIEETDINSEGNEIVIDKEILNVCKICVYDYKGHCDVKSIEKTTYNAHCDDCGTLDW